MSARARVSAPKPAPISTTFHPVQPRPDGRSAGPCWRRRRSSGRGPWSAGYRARPAAGRPSRKGSPGDCDLDSSLAQRGHREKPDGERSTTWGGPAASRSSTTQVVVAPVAMSVMVSVVPNASQGLAHMPGGASAYQVARRARRSAARSSAAARPGRRRGGRGRRSWSSSRVRWWAASSSPVPLPSWWWPAARSLSSSAPGTRRGATAGSLHRDERRRARRVRSCRARCALQLQCAAARAVPLCSSRRGTPNSAAAKDSRDAQAPPPSALVPQGSTLLRGLSAPLLKYGWRGVSRDDNDSDGANRKRAEVFFRAISPGHGTQAV